MSPNRCCEFQLHKFTHPELWHHSDKY